MMIYELRGGGKLSLVPSPSLIIVCMEARSALHAGKKKEDTVCAYAGFHETQDIFVIINRRTNFELSQQFLVGLRASLCRAQKQHHL